MKRIASHAGTWYTDNKAELNEEINEYFDKVSVEESLPIKGTRAIIAPHAGLTYSGPTAAYAYKSIDISNIKRVFLLGPSHHEYIDGCSLSKCDTYSTPFGDIQLDKEVIKELDETGRFDWMSPHVDEKEHSLEMHLPFIYKTFEDKINNIKLVPILVGSISERKEKLYGELLSRYLKEKENLFIVSSDFCHWGARFRYTYYTETNDIHRPIQLSKITFKQISRPIYESIQDLDFRGIGLIESLSFSDFHSYLEKTKNTICGRHPIAILLSSIEHIHQTEITLKCLKYDQSSRCKRFEDSSVSYASLYLKFD